jgi:hypothetical protein
LPPCNFNRFFRTAHHLAHLRQASLMAGRKRKPAACRHAGSIKHVAGAREVACKVGGKVNALVLRLMPATSAMLAVAACPSGGTRNIPDAPSLLLYGIGTCNYFHKTNRPYGLFFEKNVILLTVRNTAHACVAGIKDWHPRIMIATHDLTAARGYCYQWERETMLTKTTVLILSHLAAMIFGAYLVIALCVSL